MEAKYVSEHRLDLLVPRPAYTYYDRTGYLSIYGIWRIMSDGFSELEDKNGCSTSVFVSNHLRLFKIRDTTNYSPKIHRKISSTNGDLLLRLSLASVGTTSVCISHELFNSVSMEKLVHADCWAVSIDTNTHRPCKLPDWIIDKYSTLSNSESLVKSEKQATFVPPDNAFKSKVLTRYSDMDINYHVTFIEYYRFCSDCASEASLCAYYRYYNDDMSWFPVLETDATFLGETSPCAELGVFTWQDSTNIQRIYFVIYNKDKAVFQASYLYGIEQSRECVSSRL